MKVLFYVRRLSIAALAGLGLATFACSQSSALATGPTVEIELKSEATARAVSRQLGADYGDLLGVNGKVARVRLRAGLNLKSVLQSLDRNPHVTYVKAPAEKVVEMGYDATSVKSIKRLIRAKKAITGYDKKKLDPNNLLASQAERESAGVDWLEAYENYLKERSYPNDRVDWLRYGREAEHVKGMPAGRIEAATNGAPTLGASAKWEFVGPQNVEVPYRIYYGVRPINGRVNAIAYDPSNTNTIYLAGAQGGIWKTIDAGATWRPLTDTVLPFLWMGSLAVNPANPQEIWAGGGDYHGFGIWGLYSAGLWRSPDGGDTWTQVRLPRADQGDTAITNIQFDPDNPRIMIVSTGYGISGESDVYRSIDGGQNWAAVRGEDGNVLPASQWTGLAVSLPNLLGRRAYYASGQGNESSLYRSFDRGVTWTKLTLPWMGNAGPLPIATSKVFPGTLYLMATARNRIFKSIDYGANWNDVTNNFPDGFNWIQYFYNYHLTTSVVQVGSSLQDAIYAGQIDIVLSTDGGASWNSIGGPTYSWDAVTHNDQHCAAVNPTNPNEVLIGNDGGIYRYTITPSGGVMTGLSKTLGITQFYTADWHPSEPDHMLGGTQDNATPQTTGDLANWGNVAGGDGAGCAIDVVNPNVQYASWQGQGIFRTGNAWKTSQFISPDWGTDQIPFIGRLAIDPNLTRYMYAGTNFLWRWDDRARSWTPRLGNRNFGAPLRAISVAPGDARTLYVGTFGSRVSHSEDGGETWRDLAGAGVTDAQNLPAGMLITSISINPRDKNDILVTTGGSHPFARVWRLLRQSRDVWVWQALNGSFGNRLPNVNAGALARDPWNPNVWYVGTDMGAFMTVDNGQSYTNITGPLGLPNVEVTALQANRRTGYLNAATFGRGLWRIRIAQNPERMTLQSLTVNPRRIRGGSGATATLTMQNPTDAMVTVRMTYTGGVFGPSAVNVPAGARTTTFDVFAADVSRKTVANMVARGPVNTVSTGAMLVPVPQAFFVEGFIDPDNSTGALSEVFVVFQNVSTAAEWREDEDYELRILGADAQRLWGVTRVPLNPGEVILPNRIQLNPNNQKAFRFNVSMPTIPGTYDLRLQMWNKEIGFFGPEIVGTYRVTQVAFDAQFISQFTLSEVEAGRNFRVGVTMRNTGDQRWTRATGVMLGAISPVDNRTWGLNRVLLDETEEIRIRGQKSFAWSAKAPTTPGNYSFHWRMRQNESFFGETTPLTTIRVIPVQHNAEFVSYEGPSEIIAGSSVDVSFTFRNTGPVTWTRDKDILLMAFPSGRTWGRGQVLLADFDTIAPGETKKFTFRITAPTEPGEYNFAWRMSKIGLGYFGQASVPTKLKVTDGGDDGDGADGE
jgi:photosystem II stability/assembly factor-like uncharacterized protein